MMAVVVKVMWTVGTGHLSVTVMTAITTVM